MDEREEIAYTLQMRKRRNTGSGGPSRTSLKVRTEPYTCPFGCNDGFETKQELIHHINSTHNEENLQYGAGNLSSDQFRCASF